MKTKLKARWDKRQDDLMFWWPKHKCDAHYLHGVFDQHFLTQMLARGFDITTIKFEITLSKSKVQDGS